MYPTPLPPKTQSAGPQADRGQRSASRRSSAARLFVSCVAGAAGGGEGVPARERWRCLSLEDDPAGRTGTPATASVGPTAGHEDEANRAQAVSFKFGNDGAGWYQRRVTEGRVRERLSKDAILVLMLELNDLRPDAHQHVSTASWLSTFVLTSFILIYRNLLKSSPYAIRVRGTCRTTLVVTWSTSTGLPLREDGVEP
uniref:Uncharacterized protein n=1 Tax=Mycena chlorophos TaxID=658473 RepID=A0ABQ0KZB1_MYCCL|nr:predicted protein [Mycena chlorophos]